MSHPHERPTDDDLAWEEAVTKLDGRLTPQSDPWHTVKVVLCTAIVFAFLSYLAYLSR